ncbi:MAG TPA: MarR family winged helix-turn-helix transcriptional regulator [Polyangiaceae bacterium]
MSHESSHASQFIQAFSAVFEALHRRYDPAALNLTPEGRGLLLHLAWSGPLSIGDIAQHIERAQSVVSESVSALESHGLLVRVRDPRDRRRTLVWLTDRAIGWLAQEQEPLDRARTEAALDAMEPARREHLIAALSDFVEATKRVSARPRREPRDTLLSRATRNPPNEKQPNHQNKPKQAR